LVTNVREQIGRRETTSVVGRPTESGLVHYASMWFRPCCFAAGTEVTTLAGPKAIETVQVGDLVLAQDARTGSVGYKPVLTVFRFRPTETVRLTIGEEVIETTPLHKFWVVGRGWVMARELAAGDVVRTLGGTAVVGAQEKDEVRQVFNLEVAGSGSFFVGKAAVLVRDNAPEARGGEAPFDAVTLGGR
jgi:hypothetical protein